MSWKQPSTGDQAASPEKAKYRPPPGLSERGVPRCLRPLRFNTWIRVGTTIVAVLGMLELLGWCGVPTGSIGEVALLGGLAFAETIGRRRKSRFTHRLLANVLEHELAACLRCGYVLSGLPEKHRCPECGTPFDLEQTKLAWERWFATDQFGRISQISRDSVRDHIEQSRRMRTRRTCIRCGNDLADAEDRVCPECGAKHEIKMDLALPDRLDYM